MSLNRLFELIDEIRKTGNWKAAFGEPQQLEGKTIIPVAQVSYGFGLGFGQGGQGAPEESETQPASGGEGGGGGGGAMSKPLGALVVTPDAVRFEPVVDAIKIPLAGMALSALLFLQVGMTLRAIFGHKQPAE